jgi:hypothetical protein
MTNNLRQGLVLGTQHSHQDEVFPAIRVELGFTADPLAVETASQVAVNGPAISGQHLQLDTVDTA